VTTSPESPVPQDAAGSEPAVDGRSGRSASLVAAGILLSRAAGVIRESILAHFLGTTVYASAFRAALRMPNVLQNLLGEGTLSASFIPVYSRLLHTKAEDGRAAGRLAGSVFALLLVTAGVLALFGAALAPALVSIFTTGFSGELREVTIRCVRVIFPMTGLLVLSAWALGILNSHGRFLLSYSAPVVWNLTIIAALVVFGRRLEGADLVIAASWGALAGGGLQFLVQVPWVMRLERTLSIRWDTRSPDVQQVLHNAGPAILGRGGVQLSAYLDQWLASFLFAGAFATLAFAQTLYVLPVSLFGMSVAAAELPAMARQSGERAEALRERMEQGLRRIAILVMPAVAGYLVLGDVIVGLLYQSGEFIRVDTLLVSFVLAAYSLGLVASTSTRLYASAFYALNDTRTPARIALIRVSVSTVLGAALMLIGERFALRAPFAIVANTGDALARPLGVVGLAVGAAVGAWTEWSMLRSSIGRRIGGLGMGRRTLLRLGLAAGLPAVVLRMLLFVLPPHSTIINAAFVLPLFGLGYLGMARILGFGEVSALLTQILRRPRSRGA
jgi:putative peptidoglycan lipid II flippase